MDQDFPDQVSFINKKGVEVVFEVKYEWMPIMCTSCNIIGQRVEECKKGELRKEWRPKAVQVNDDIEKIRTELYVRSLQNDGFQVVGTNARKLASQRQDTVTRNVCV